MALRITEKVKEVMVMAYTACETEDERDETVIDLSTMYNTTTMQVRQVLQSEKVYFAVEGKTDKEQYANALYAVTGIQPKEWMKLNFKSQVKLMKIFRDGSK